MTQGYTPEGYVFTATYDAENRLVSITYNDGAINHETKYFYSGDGLLAKVEKYESSIKVDETRFIKAGLLPVQERDENNNVTREYTWGLNMGGGIGGLLNLNQGGLDYSYLYDGKGNVSALLDSSQNVVASYKYDVFGVPLKKVGTFDQPFRFSTKRYDEKTGLSYYGYRFYNPTIGRWLTRDPLGEIGGINLYQIVGNSPMNRIDPTGLFSVDFGVGAQFGIVDITYSFFNGLGGSLTTPGLGLGGFVCFNICDEEPDSDCSPYPFDDKPLEPVPLTYSAGAGRRASISFSDDFCNICVNIGPSVGLPLTIGLPLGTD